MPWSFDVQGFNSKMQGIQVPYSWPRTCEVAQSKGAPLSLQCGTRGSDTQFSGVAPQRSLSARVVIMEGSGVVAHYNSGLLCRSPEGQIHTPAAMQIASYG